MSEKLDGQMTAELVAELMTLAKKYSDLCGGPVAIVLQPADKVYVASYVPERLEMPTARVVYALSGGISALMGGVVEQAAKTFGRPSDAH